MPWPPALPEDHGFLQTTEIAIIIRKSLKTAQTYRRYNGQSMPKPEAFSNYSPKRNYPKVPEKVWRNKTWFAFMVNEAGFGFNIISKIIDRSNFRTKGIASEFGIKSKNTSESLNPYCNKEWLEDKYVTEGLTLRQCARIAGVNPYTMYTWLAKYGIEVRSNFAGRVPRLQEAGYKKTNIPPPETPVS